MHDAALAPDGTDCGDLTERYCRVGRVECHVCHCHRGRYAEVGDVGERHVGFVFDDDGQFVVPFPQLSNTKVIGRSLEHQLGCCLCDA